MNTLMRSAIASATLSALCAAQPVLAQKPPLVLKPTSKWVVDYKDDGCRLVRQFGEGDSIVLAAFNRFGPTDDFQLTVAGKPVKRGMSGTAKVQFGPAEKERDIDFMVGSVGKLPALIFPRTMKIIEDENVRKKIVSIKDWVPDDSKPVMVDPARTAAVTYINFGKPFSPTITLQTGSLGKPFAALTTCVEDLLTTWGIDPVKHRTLSKNVTPTEAPARWVTSDDYPLDMLRAGQPAIVQFRLMVDAAGKATSCHIQETTRPKAFDDAVCKSLMKRAKFSPALDTEGKPISSFWRNTVHFAIPT